MFRIFASRLAIRLAGALGIAIGMLTGDAAARPLDEVVGSGVLRVIAYLDNAPFSWDDNGKPRGIDVDIADAIANELGVKPEVILRMPGEKGDDDLRVNVWKGPLTGGGVGDLMMHVPIDREFAARNPEAVIGNPYFQERIAVAIDSDRTGPNPTFDIFKRMKIGVQLGTVSDYFLMRFEDGALIDNIVHHVRAEDGAKEFKSKEIAALMGQRARIEALLHDIGVTPRIAEPAMDGIVRNQWVVGMAWKENSRDLGYAVQASLDKLKASGKLAEIFRSYGVTYIQPPIDDGVSDQQN
jgi:ABC-type amino acid transport substrate-binding protein